MRPYTEFLIVPATAPRPRLRPPHLVGPPERPPGPGVVAAVDRRPPVEQVGAVDQPAADQVRDGHLGVLRLALDAPLGDQQPRADQLPAVARAHVGVDHEVGGAELVLHGDHDHAPGGARPLPQPLPLQDEAGQPDARARPGRGEAAGVVEPERVQRGPR
jgi:hypothetical protein